MSDPALGAARQARAAPGPILSIRDLGCHFTTRGRGLMRRRAQVVRALDGVSLDLEPGRTFGIVGESGSGKSTLARCVMRLERPTSGEILFEGKDLAALDETALRPVRRDVQMVFQDPWASLNPRHTVREILTEPWEIHDGVVPAAERPERVAELLRLVGLDPGFAHRYPSQFSGGQRQRISIARALALSPKLLILDEAVSALDVSVQAQILNLLADLQARFGMSYLFISHDLSVVRHVCDRIGVMYLGKLVEVGATRQIFEAARHPYTRALLSAMPDAPEADRIVLEGEVPSPLDPPSGCAFRTRCWRARPECARAAPQLAEQGQGHALACLNPVVGDPAP
ncbi:ABC transporter ATP-binding protein [Halovulum sp. GXIMD14794]